MNIGAPVTATDPDNDTLTYSLGGTNAASFGIVATSGQLQTKAELDFEIKSTYTVTVTATDQGHLSDITTVTITVTNVDETPSVSGQISISYKENGTDAVATYTASDPDGTSITWDLLGDDNSLFSISTLGVLTFKIAPDFEAPADANTDNEYLVTVQASDGSNTDTQPVTVTVTNVNEPPTFAKETDASHHLGKQGSQPEHRSPILGHRPGRRRNVDLRPGRDRRGQLRHRPAHRPVADQSQPRL